MNFVELGQALRKLRLSLAVWMRSPADKSTMTSHPFAPRFLKPASDASLAIPARASAGRSGEALATNQRSCWHW